MPHRKNTPPEFSMSPVSAEALKLQGDSLLDSLASRLPVLAAGEEKLSADEIKLSPDEIRSFAEQRGLTGQAMANLYKNVCEEHFPALAIIFYGIMKDEEGVLTASVRSAMDGNPLHHFDITPVIESLRDKYSRYQYIETVGDPFRPKSPGRDTNGDPDDFNHG